MTRALLLCPEPLGHRQPAGVGIRFLEIARALRQDGHAVTILSPGGGKVDQCESHPMTPDLIARQTEVNDVAIVQGHAANDLFSFGVEIPTVVDLYDPFIVENLHYWKTLGSSVFSHDHATLMRSVAAGDFFLCASGQQRLFYLGLLLAGDRIDPGRFAMDPGLESLLSIVPFGVPPPRASVPPRSDGRGILFGGIYDWYDPILAIDAVAIARAKVPSLTLSFTLHPNAESTPQGMTAAAQQHVRRHGYDDFVEFRPWVAYEERASHYDRFFCGLLTFPSSIETDLSMRTRIYDYLWGGLPVVSSSAQGTDAILRRFGAGVVLESNSAPVIAAALVELATGPERYANMVAGTQDFVQQQQWPDVLEPLLRFCRKPLFQRTGSSTVSLPQATGGTSAKPASLLDKVRNRIRRAGARS